MLQKPRAGPASSPRPTAGAVGQQPQPQPQPAAAAARCVLCCGAGPQGGSLPSFLPPGCPPWLTACSSTTSSEETSIRSFAEIWVLQKSRSAYLFFTCLSACLPAYLPAAFRAPPLLCRFLGGLPVSLEAAQLVAAGGKAGLLRPAAVLAAILNVTPFPIHRPFATYEAYRQNLLRWVH